MAADVGETVNAAVFAADDDERVRVDLHGKVIPRPQNLATMPRKEPAATPNPIQVGTINNLIGVKLARQRPTRLAPGDQRIDQVWFAGRYGFHRQKHLAGQSGWQSRLLVLA